MEPNLAAAAGGPVTVLSHDGGEKGRFFGGRVISLRRDLGPVNRRCTLAHELGHVVLGHDPAATGWWKVRQEKAADRWAAETLIDPAEYQAAEQAHGPHPGGIAAELGVTVHLVEVFRATYKKEAPRDFRSRGADRATVNTSTNDIFKGK